MSLFCSFLFACFVGSLPLSELSSAVDLFSKNIHDDSLPSSIQTMSCKLLLNLVESIRTKSDEEKDGNVSEHYTLVSTPGFRIKKCSLCDGIQAWSHKLLYDCRGESY